jgi:hypothetical protein
MPTVGFATHGEPQKDTAGTGIIAGALTLRRPP